MSSTAERLAVPIPKPLRARPKDARGYPIPWIVFIDRKGGPHFPINDERRAAACFTKRLCPLCGRRLEAQAWFVGGPKCFLHPQGAFLDPPAHHECARYALAVCPYLAAPSYARRLDGKKLDADAVAGGTVVIQEPGQDERPQLFITAAATKWVRHPSGTPGMHVIVPERPWLWMEAWRFGSMIDPAEAGTLIRDAERKISGGFP